MREIIRRKTDQEKAWKKELVTINTYNKDRFDDSQWYCDECKTLRSGDDFGMMWIQSEGTTELHCPKCDNRLTCGDQYYFENNFIFKP